MSDPSSARDYNCPCEWDVRYRCWVFCANLSAASRTSTHPELEPAKFLNKVFTRGTELATKC
eukprot:228519-Amphidinium_carterae.1